MSTPRRVALAAFMIYLALALTKLTVHGFDPSYFVMTGTDFCDARATPPELTVPTKDFRGFDGQFYYRFALNPFTNHATEFGITIDNPPYRHQRILNSFIVHILSFGGNPTLALYAFIVLNLAGASALAWLCALLVRDMGERPAWGLLAAIYPGFLISFSRNLLELTSCSLMLGALLAARRSRWWTAAICLSLGILTREMMLFLILAVAVVQVGSWLLARTSPRAKAFIEDKLGAPAGVPSRSALIASVIPILVYLTWQVILRFAWGRAPALANHGSLRPPLSGVGKFVWDSIQHAYVLDLIQVTLLALLVFAVAQVLLRSPAPLWTKLGWLGWLLLISMLGETDYWVDQASYVRVTGEFFVLGMLILLAARPYKMPRFYAAWGALSILHFALAGDLLTL